MPLLYVVGLGGTGSSIVIKFAEKFKSVMEEAQKNKISIGVKVQIIDLAREPSVDDAIKSNILKVDDVHVVPSYIVEQEKSYLPVLADSKKEWFPEQLKRDLPYRVKGEHGVERKRPVARLLFHSPQVAWSIFNALKHDIEDFSKKSEEMRVNVLYVAIVASLGGGWGSGTFIDVAALIRHLVKKIAGDRLIPRVIGIFVLPYGYATRPPPGVRVEFEEENAMAALKELHLLHLYRRYGIEYSETFQEIGKIVYSSGDVEPFDVVFLVSYSNVPGATYTDQFNRIDETIADFLAFLALMPGNKEELEKMKGIVSGISISENILGIYAEADNIVPLPDKKENIEEFSWRPIIATFGIAEYGINLKRLSEYFEKDKKYKEIIKRIEELKKQYEEKEKQLKDSEAVLILSQKELDDCRKDGDRMLKGETKYTPPESLKNVILDEVKRIEQDPVGYHSRKELLKFIDKIKSDPVVKDNITRQYLVLRYFEQELRALEIKYGEELAKISESIKIKDKELAKNIDAIKELSPLARYVLRKDKEYRENMKNLQKEIQDLKNRDSILREKIDGIRVVRDHVSDQMSSLAGEVSVDELCKEKLNVVSKNEELLRNIRVELNRVKAELSRLDEKDRKNIEEELEKIKRDPTIIKFMAEAGEPTFNYLMSLWEKDPSEFMGLTLTDINKIIREHGGTSDVFDRVVTNLGLNAKPLLSDSTDAKTCYNHFYSRYLKTSAALSGGGVRIVVASPSDVDEIARRLGSSHTISLSYLGTNAKLVILNPVVPLPCTDEFKEMYGEYKRARDANVYQVHVLPVNSMVDKLVEEINKRKGCGR